MNKPITGGWGKRKDTEHNFCGLCGYCGSFAMYQMEHKFLHTLWWKQTRGMSKSMAIHNHFDLSTTQVDDEVK